MPIAINWALNILLGAATAHSVARRPAPHAASLPWPVLQLCALQGLYLTPLHTAVVRFYPHWATFYLFDPARYPQVEAHVGLMSAGAVLGNFLCMGVGYAAQSPHRRGHSVWARSAVGLAIAALLILAGVGGTRLVYAGDYADFAQGEAPFVLRCACGWLTLAAWLGAAAFVAVRYRASSGGARRARQPAEPPSAR